MPADDAEAVVGAVAAFEAALLASPDGGDWPNRFGATPTRRRRRGGDMAETNDVRLDLRDRPPAERHPLIHEAFADLPPGGTLTVVNDHEPKPLFYEFRAEVEAFDADGYAVEREGPETFVARLPKEGEG